jgi:hypothetical protein
VSTISGFSVTFELLPVVFAMPSSIPERTMHAEARQDTSALIGS